MGSCPPLRGRGLTLSPHPLSSSTLILSHRARTAMSLYLTTKRTEDIALRVTTLRQAFTTLRSSTQSKNQLYVAGKVLLGALVQANHKDEAQFIRAYDDLVGYLSDPSKQGDIEMELAEHQISHVNLIDILYELVLFGVMVGRPLVVQPGGFVERLYSLLHSCLPASNMKPEAERCLLHLKGGLMMLLDDMFGQEVPWYFNTESLVVGVSSLLEHHLQLLMASF